MWYSDGYLFFWKNLSFNSLFQQGKTMPELEANYSVVQKTWWLQWHITEESYGNIIKLYCTELNFYTSLLTFSLSLSGAQGGKFSPSCYWKHVPWIWQEEILCLCPVISVGAKLYFWAFIFYFTKNSLPDHIQYLHLLNTTFYYVLKMAPKLSQ